MSKIPTAEEFANKLKTESLNYDPFYSDDMIERDIPKLLQEFAKLHVKAALEAAAKNAKTRLFPIDDGSDTGGYATGIDKDSILNAYPDKLII